MIKVKNVSKSYSQGSSVIPVLENISFSLKTSKSLAIVGPSGCGKTTLLSLLAGLDAPDQGELWVYGQNLGGMNEKERVNFRSQNIGMVFQQFHLIPHLTVLENVCLPLEIHSSVFSKTSRNILEKARTYLKKVDLLHRLHHLPSQLSGGEQQRTAIARACIHNPKLILADEPSGSLDQKSAQQAVQLLFSLVQQHKSTLIIVTHNQSLAQRCQNQFFLSEQSWT